MKDLFPAATGEQSARHDSSPSKEDDIPLRIGSYRPYQKLGQGGMGVVYAARQENPSRNVAVKVLQHAFPSDEVRRRFEYECRVLARLRHPCIAQLYEMGSTESPTGGSLPFFAMEYVEGGKTLIEYAEDHALSLPDRIRLFLRVLEGIQYGHQRGVIHRDLKPANLLIDSEGNPKIIDFGVARSTEADLTLASMHTEVGQLLGTPLYMSPEQIAGDPVDIDVRTDVYSMGVVLFELVSGQAPYNLERRSIVEVCEEVRHGPTRRLSSIGRKFRGDLDTVVATAMAKDRERRYSSVSALIADLKRYLNREPIAARFPNVLYQIHMFGRRHKGLFAAAHAVLFVLVAGVIVSSRFAFIAIQRADEALRQAYRGNLFAAAASLKDGDISAAERYLDAAPEPLRGWEWRHFESRVNREAKILPGPAGDPMSVSLSPGGEFLVSLDANETLIWDVEKGYGLRRIRHGTLDAASAFFSADGSRLFLQGNRLSDDGKDLNFFLETLDPRTGEKISSFHLTDDRRGISGFAAHPDSGRFVVQTGAGIRVADLATGEILATRETDADLDRYSPLAFSPDGSRIAVAAADSSACILEAGTLKTIGRLEGRGNGFHVFTFSPDGKTLAGGLSDTTIRIWPLEGGSRPRDLEGHGAYVSCLAFSPNGERLASGSMDGTLRLWDVATGKCISVLSGFNGCLTSIAFWNDGRRMATSSIDRLIRVWDLGILDAPTVLRGHASYVNSVVMSPDGARIISAGWDGLVGEPGAIRWWDAESGALIGYWRRKTMVIHLAISPDGRTLATGTAGGLVVLDAETGTVVAEEDGTAAYPRAAFDAAGRLAFGDQDGLLHIVDPRTLAETACVPRMGASMEPIQFSKTGRWLGVLIDGKSVAVLDAGTFHELFRQRDCNHCSFSPDDCSVAFSTNGEVRIVRIPEGEEIGRGSTPSAWWAEYSPDGTRIVAGTGAGPIRLLDAQRLEEVTQLTGHGSYVFGVAFDPARERFVTGSGDGTVRIWETEPLAARLKARHDRERIVAQVEPLVTTFFDQGMPTDQIVDLLKNRHPFESPRHREVALQIALGESLKRLQ